MAFIDDIKQYFQTGDYPTQAQFYEFFSKIWFKDQALGISDITSLQTILNDLAASGGGGGGGTGAAIFTGAGVPSNALGINGDIYIDTVAPNDLYKKILGVYVLQTSLQGVAGAVGAVGAVGAAGVAGAVGAAGAIGPAGPAGATGSAGAAGATGAAGAAGAAGSAGAPGATGATGAAGPIGPKGSGGKLFNYYNFK